MRAIPNQDRLSSTMATLPSSSLTHHPQPSTIPRVFPLSCPLPEHRHCLLRVSLSTKHTRARVDVSSSSLAPLFPRAAQFHYIPQNGIYKPAHAFTAPLPPSCGGTWYESKQSRPVATLSFRCFHFLGGHGGEGKARSGSVAPSLWRGKCSS